MILSLALLAACQAGPEPRVYVPRTQVPGTEQPQSAAPATVTPTARALTPTPIYARENNEPVPQVTRGALVLTPPESPTVAAAVAEQGAGSEQTGPAEEEIAFSPLNEYRPYLVYYDETGEQPEVVLVNASLAGKRTLPLPAGSLPPRLPDALSPGSQWLAFHTGPPEPALHLMNLPSGRTTRIENLPVPDVIEWSPTGRNLAFTSGGEPGAQTEVLMYDRWRENIFRLGGGGAPILWLSWSPDNNYVLFAAAGDSCAGDCGHWTVIDIRNGRTWQPQLRLEEGQQVRFNGWRTPRLVNIVVSREGDGRSLMKSFNIYDSTESVLLDAPFENYRYDSQTGLYAVVLDQIPDHEQGQEPGIYLYNPRTRAMQPVALFADFGELSVMTWGRRGYTFLLWNDTQVFAMDPRGAVSQVAQGTFRGRSPRGSWIVVVDQASDPPVMHLLNDRFQVVHQLSGENAGELFWSEDEATLFSVLQGRLYALPLARREWVLVDAQLPESSLVWDRSFLYAWK